MERRNRAELPSDVPDAGGCRSRITETGRARLQWYPILKSPTVPAEGKSNDMALSITCRENRTEGPPLPLWPARGVFFVLAQGAREARRSGLRPSLPTRTERHAPAASDPGDACGRPARAPCAKESLPAPGATGCGSCTRGPRTNAPGGLPRGCGDSARA